MTEQERLIEVIAEAYRDWRCQDKGIHAGQALINGRLLAAEVVDALGIENYGTWNHRWTDELERDDDRGDNRLYRIHALDSVAPTPEPRDE